MNFELIDRGSVPGSGGVHRFELHAKQALASASVNWPSISSMRSLIAHHLKGFYVSVARADDGFLLELRGRPNRELRRAFLNALTSKVPVGI
jgi:hypothetical protein